jgi:hypothetical protein
MAFSLVALHVTAALMAHFCATLTLLQTDYRVEPLRPDHTCSMDECGLGTDHFGTGAKP